MFKIWITQHSSRSNGLYYRGDKTSRDGKVSRKDKGKGDPERLPYSVHEELRHIAKKAMESLERDILGELDACMTQSGAVKPYEKPLLWACLWQLIFVYGQLLESSCKFRPRRSVLGGAVSLTALQRRTRASSGAGR